MPVIPHMAELALAHRPFEALDAVAARLHLCLRDTRRELTTTLIVAAATQSRMLLRENRQCVEPRLVRES
jgi:hypothetical protein